MRDCNVIPINSSYVQNLRNSKLISNSANADFHLKPTQYGDTYITDLTSNEAEVFTSFILLGDEIEEFWFNNELDTKVNHLELTRIKGFRKYEGDTNIIPLILSYDELEAIEEKMLRYEYLESLFKPEKP